MAEVLEPDTWLAIADNRCCAEDMVNIGKKMSEIDKHGDRQFKRPSSNKRSGAERGAWKEPRLVMEIGPNEIAKCRLRRFLGPYHTVI